MIHEAMVLEYSGKRLALMEWASANRLLVFASLAANLFFPWGIARTMGLGAILLGLGAYAMKMVVFYAAIALIESSIAKSGFFAFRTF